MQFSELVLLLCDLQCKDSMTLGAGSQAPVAPFNAGHLNKHTPLLPRGSSQSDAHGLISQFLYSQSILDLLMSGLKTSVKCFHLLLHHPNYQRGKPRELLWVTKLFEDFFFFFAVILWNQKEKNSWPPLTPTWCCCL